MHPALDLSISSLFQALCSWGRALKRWRAREKRGKTLSASFTLILNYWEPGIAPAEAKLSRAYCYFSALVLPPSPPPKKVYRLFSHTIRVMALVVQVRVQLIREKSEFGLWLVYCVKQREVLDLDLPVINTCFGPKGINNATKNVNSLLKCMIAWHVFVTTPMTYLNSRVYRCQRLRVRRVYAPSLTTVVENVGSFYAFLIITNGYKTSQFVRIN